MQDACIWLNKCCWLLEFHVLATSGVIPGQLLTWHRVQSWQLYSAAPLGNQATSYLGALSTHWTNQPINTNHQARKWQVATLYVIGFTEGRIELSISREYSVRSTDSYTAAGASKCKWMKRTGHSGPRINADLDIYTYVKVWLNARSFSKKPWQSQLGVDTGV